MGTAGRWMVLLAAAALLVGCSDRTGRALADKDNDLSKRQKAIETLADDVKEKEETIAALAKREQERQEIIDRLMKQLADAKKTVEPGTKDGAPDGVQVGVSDGGLIKITVADRVLFESGEAKLRESAHKVLATVSKVIHDKYPGNVVRVEGHTDSDPIRHTKWKDNMDLSLARARAVYDQLAKCGMESAKMYVAGYGESQPVAANTTVDSKSKNRRVEIVIMPSSVKVMKEDLKVSSRATTKAAK